MPPDLAPAAAAEACYEALAWNAEGLLPVICQQHDSGEILMQAWADREALRMSLRSGLATYYSRSRQRLWVKGEESGFTQRLLAVRTDCDGDCLLYLVDAPGPACHQLRRSCFSTRITTDGALLRDRPIMDV